MEKETKPNTLIDCLKCEDRSQETVKIGKLDLCKKCAAEEFSTNNPLVEEREQYVRWMTIRAAKADEEAQQAMEEVAAESQLKVLENTIKMSEESAKKGSGNNSNLDFLKRVYESVKNRKKEE